MGNSLRRKGLSCLVASFLPLLFMSVPAANAVTGSVDSAAIESAHSPQVPNLDLTPELLAQAFNELNRSSLPRARNADGTVAFKLSEGITFALPNLAERTGGSTVVPLVNGGTRGFSGFWLEFTPAEQGMLASGATAALSAAICLIPGVGQAACVVIGIILSVASSYVTSKGTCPGNLRVDFTWTGRVSDARCV